MCTDRLCVREVKHLLSLLVEDLQRRGLPSGYEEEAFSRSGHSKIVLIGCGRCREAPHRWFELNTRSPLMIIPDCLMICSVTRHQQVLTPPLSSVSSLMKWRLKLLPTTISRTSLCSGAAPQQSRNRRWKPRSVRGFAGRLSSCSHSYHLFSCCHVTTCTEWHQTQLLLFTFSKSSNHSLTPMKVMSSFSLVLNLFIGFFDQIRHSHIQCVQKIQKKKNYRRIASALCYTVYVENNDFQPPTREKKGFRNTKPLLKVYVLK